MICMRSYFPQHQLLAFCKREHIHLMAHQPLGGKPVGVVAPHADIPGPLFDTRVNIEIGYLVIWRKANR